jgi:hypothetical protein
MESWLWQRVGELADAAPSVSDLRYHKLELIAAARMRARGEPPPAALIADERRAAVLGLAIPTVLRRVRAACDGPVVLMKGAEAAARWPRPELRPAGDIDLLVEDAEAVQRALLAAGFVELADPAPYHRLQHLCPIALPGFPIAVEIHRRPHWCRANPPALGEIVAAAQPCAAGVDGILAPRPDQHAVLLAAHAWAHDPLDRIGPLVDVAAMLAAAGRGPAARVADGWGVRGHWDVTTQAIDELLGPHPAPHRLSMWKRHLAGARERTVLEGHVTRVVAPVAAASAARAPLALTGALLAALRRAPGDTWTAKLSRSVQALRHAAW